MSKTYYVIGGEYADFTFSQIAPGREMEKHGPFSEKEALDFWRSVTGKTVDSALTRYIVKPEEDVEGERVWFVVGGEYADVTFSNIAPGRQIESYGPFSRQGALECWRALTGKTVDSALTRYKVMRQGEMYLR